MRSVVLVSSFLFIGLFFISAIKLSPQKNITEGEAIILAEEFIRINGYTKDKADTTKLQLEFLYDSGESVKDVLKKRYNSLQKKAFCITSNDQGWSIGFLSTKINLSKLDSLSKQGNLSGRGVKINLLRIAQGKF